VKILQQWKIIENDTNINLMIETLKIDYITAKLLSNRNIRTKNNAIEFLSSNKKFLNNYSCLKDVYKAIEIIEDYIKKNKKIMVFGDYDVDGVMSCVILCKTLLDMNANVDFYIPLRETDGFGLNKNIVKKIYDEKIDLIICCDNGMAAIEEIGYAKKLGIKVIIIDHHESSLDNNDKEILPGADAIINPKQESCDYYFKFLCAASICYKFSNEFYLKRNLKIPEDFIIFASIATLCDVVLLLKENRTITKIGINKINSRKLKNPGLLSLIKENKISEENLNARDISFVIGPCINACGRLDSACSAVKLLLTDDVDEAKKLSKYIFNLNSKRKKITNDIYSKFLLEFDKTNNDIKNILIIYDSNTPESISGIVAGRLKEKFNRPVIFLTNTLNENIIKASCRSVENYNIFNELSNYKDLFLKFGGHAMAAGFSIYKKDLDYLRSNLEKNYIFNNKDFINEIKIDIEIKNIDEINFELYKKIKRLEPFGNGNPEPLFILKSAHINKINFFKNNFTVLEIILKNKKIKGICFENRETLDRISKNRKADIAFSLELYQKNIQIRVKNVFYH
jgi:single-stranded-DNA-specific exonuclease